MFPLFIFAFFFFNDTATTEIYTLSLHDALPIIRFCLPLFPQAARDCAPWIAGLAITGRSEEHTSELQSLRHLVCRLLLEKKKTNHQTQRCAHTLDQNMVQPLRAQVK